VAVDGSEHSHRVLDSAIKLAKRFKAKVFLIHVVSRIEVPEEFARYVKTERIDVDPEFYYRKLVGEAILEKLGAKIVAEGLEVEKLLDFGDPADKILEAAEKIQPDFIVLGIVGMRGIRRVMAIGSVARRVVENAKVPVVVVP